MAEFDAWAQMNAKAREVLTLEVEMAFLENDAKDAVEEMKTQAPPDPEAIRDWDDKE